MRDLRDFLDESLDLPIGGVTYKVPPPSARAGLRLERLAYLSDRFQAGAELTDEEIAELHLDDNQEIDFLKDNLGPAYQQMLDDEVRFREISIAAQCAYLMWTLGREAAERYWESVGKVLAANLPQLSPITVGEVSTTPPRTSGSGTRRRRSDPATPATV